MVTIVSVKLVLVEIVAECELLVAHTTK